MVYNTLYMCRLFRYIVFLWTRVGVTTEIFLKMNIFVPKNVVSSERESLSRRGRRAPHETEHIGRRVRAARACVRKHERVKADISARSKSLLFVVLLLLLIQTLGSPSWRSSWGSTTDSTASGECTWISRLPPRAEENVPVLGNNLK